MNEFDINHDRLDTFYMSLFSSLNLDMNALLDVVKITLILSHGQGRVESGFSINEQMLLENMQEDSIVAQRMVYEGSLQGGASKVDINRTMLKYVKQAKSKQMFALEENRKKQKEGEKRREERKRASKGTCFKGTERSNCCKENFCGTNERESQQL